MAPFLLHIALVCIPKTIFRVNQGNGCPSTTLGSDLSNSTMLLRSYR